MKKIWIIILASIFVIAMGTFPAFAEFNLNPETPALVGLEYVENREQSAYNVSVRIPESAFDYEGSYHGSGEAMLEFWGRTDDGAWELYDEYFVRHFTAEDGTLRFSLMLEGRNPVSEMRVRLVYLHTGDDGAQVVLRSKWSEALTPVDADTPVSAKATTWARASDWAYEELMAADAENMIPPALFDADLNLPITRAEFAAVAVRLYENYLGVLATDEPVPVFADCDDADVAKAYRLGIVSGVGAGLFLPGEPLNREQMAQVFWKTLLLMDPAAEESIFGAPTYADEDLISPWAKEAALYLGELRFIRGTDDGRFDPAGVAAREQAVIIAYRIYMGLMP